MNPIILPKTLKKAENLNVNASKGIINRKAINSQKLKILFLKCHARIYPFCPNEKS